MLMHKEHKTEFKGDMSLWMCTRKHFGTVSRHFASGALRVYQLMASASGRFISV